MTEFQLQHLPELHYLKTGEGIRHIWCQKPWSGWRTDKKLVINSSERIYKSKPLIGFYPLSNYRWITEQANTAAWNVMQNSTSRQRSAYSYAFVFCVMSDVKNRSSITLVVAQLHRQLKHLPLARLTQAASTICYQNALRCTTITQKNNVTTLFSSQLDWPSVIREKTGRQRGKIFALAIWVRIIFKGNISLSNYNLVVEPESSTSVVLKLTSNRPNVLPHRSWSYKWLLFKRFTH